MSRLKEVIVFDGYVKEIRETVAIVKVDKSSENATNNSVLIIPLSITATDLEFAPEQLVAIKCFKDGILTVETELDSPRSTLIEKHFVSNGDKKAAKIYAQQLYEEEFKFLSGTSMQAIAAGARSEFIVA